MVTASARAAGTLLALATVKADDAHDQLASLLADPGSPEEARAAALESLLTLNDPRLDGALAQALRDARLRSEEHTSELQSRLHLVCRLLLEKKKKTIHRPI